jgi:hypothetical protein
VIGFAAWQPGESACFAGLVGPVARNLQLNESVRRVNRAQQHNVWIVSIRRLAGVGHFERADRGGAVPFHMRKDGLRLFARVTPDVPAGDDQILLDIGAATDEFVVIAGRMDID